MPLHQPNIQTNAAPAASSTAIRAFDIDGLQVTRYNALAVQGSEIAANLAKLGTELRTLGTDLLLGQAVMNPTAAPASIVLKDEGGASLRFTFKDAYSAVDAEAATNLFDKQLKRDVNDFVQVKVAAKFNADVFTVQKGCERKSGGGKTAVNLEAGDFSPELFNLYSKAIEQATAFAIAEGLLPVGTGTPLSSAEVVSVKPDFHQNRFAAFPSVELQNAIIKVCKNTTALTPIVAAATLAVEKPAASNVIDLAGILTNKKVKKAK